MFEVSFLLVPLQFVMYELIIRKDFHIYILILIVGIPLNTKAISFAFTDQT